MKRWLLAALLLCALLPASLAGAQMSFITDGPGIWKLVAKADDATALLDVPREGPQGQGCLRLDFTFRGATDQWAIVGATVPGVMSDEYQAVKITYRAQVARGVFGPMVVLHEQEGADYYYEPSPPPTDQWQTYYLPLEGFKLAMWSQDTNPDFQPAHVNELRFAVGGKAEGGEGQGSLWVAAVELVKALPPDAELPPRTWLPFAADKAQMTATSPKEGPAGERVTRLDFTFPPDADAYALALTMVLARSETVGARALRLTYKTALPAGVTGPRLVLGEGTDKAQYTTVLTAAPEWQTVEVPLSSLTLGEWSKDDNGQLDLDKLVVLALGVEGKVTAAAPAGAIWLKEFKFLK